jgi:small conductance mechanosensitive channel
MDIRSLVVDLAVRYGFEVLGALVILVAGLLAGRWIGGLLELRLRGRAMEPPMRQLIVRVVKVVVLLFAGVVALDKLGFQIAPLVAGIGVAGLGIGIALQGVLGNLVAGLTIIFTKPFRVGEYVEIAGVRGDVASIELFSTTLLHPDHSRVVIPNRKIVGEILHNFGTTRQLHLSVTLPLTVDVGEALAAATDVVTRNSRVLKEPAPQVGIAQLGDGGMKIGVHPWVRVVDVVPAEAELYRSLTEQFRGRGLALGSTAPRSRPADRSSEGASTAPSDASPDQQLGLRRQRRRSNGGYLDALRTVSRSA